MNLCIGRYPSLSTLSTWAPRLIRCKAFLFRPEDTALCKASSRVYSESKWVNQYSIVPNSHHCPRKSRNSWCQSTEWKWLPHSSTYHSVQKLFLHVVKLVNERRYKLAKSDIFWAKIQATSYFGGPVRLRTEVLRTSSLTRPGFKLMTSGSW